jgi:CheY-like chemotaxis protein
MKSLVKSKKILIVEDNPHMSTLLSDILEIFDFQTIRANDGEEALVFLKSEDFDMVITDLKMPKIGGMELLNSIKATQPQLPVVVITAYEKPSTQDEIFKAKADGFLAKPFTVKDIEGLLRKVLDYSK